MKRNRLQEDDLIVIVELASESSLLAEKESLKQCNWGKRLTEMNEDQLQILDNVLKEVQRQFEIRYY